MDRRGREGAIVEVLERRLNRLIGRFEMESGTSFVVPDDARVQTHVKIPSYARQDATSGQPMVCEITPPPTAHRPPLGRVLAWPGVKRHAAPAVETARCDS